MSKRKCVLIVDDSREIVSATCLRVKALGYEAIEAYDGQQAIASAARSLPDAIVLDVRMPVMDGLEALSQLKHREDTRHIPVVMLSASIVDEQAALDAGARYFMRKPFDGGGLVEALENVTA